jgi:hypothetical protein
MAPGRINEMMPAELRVFIALKKMQRMLEEKCSRIKVAAN